MLIKTQILNLVAADHPTLQNEDTIRQIESKLQKSEQHLQDMASQNVKLRYELGRLKEVVRGCTGTDESSISATSRTSLVHFEFSLTFGDVRLYMMPLYSQLGDAGKVWFSGKLDANTGKVVSLKTGRMV
jgi:glucose-6-phosphate 1-dehydrogenase